MLNAAISVSWTDYYTCWSLCCLFSNHGNVRYHDLQILYRTTVVLLLCTEVCIHACVEAHWLRLHRIYWCTCNVSTAASIFRLVQKHQTPNSFRDQCPRHFWDIDPEILHVFHVFDVPLPCLLRIDFCFFFRWKFGIPEDPFIPRGTLNTCAIFQGPSPKNGVDI